MNPIILIPARMAATRLPGKPLAEIGGAPMIVHVVRAAMAANLGRVAVAAGDEAIAEAVRAAGGEAVLTDPELASGSDRVLAALRVLDPAGAHDVIVNLQGDMPFFDPAALRCVFDRLADRQHADVATPIALEASPTDRTNPDVVKAVVALEADGRGGRALYFTRSILYGEGPVWRHVGIYAWRRAALEAFTAAPPSALERREKLEQLRALELGLRIEASVMEAAPLSVDNPGDLAVARAYAKEHGL